MMNPLIIFAMKEEAQDLFSDTSLLYTGIGKVNATYALTKALSNDQRPSIVINMGTAGSSKFDRGSVVNCTKFVQRDMDVTALGIEKYKTPFSDDPIELDYGLKIENLPEAVCATGDSFDVTATEEFDVVDMEAYALSAICKRENIPFLCLKYISDGADNDAANDWNEALHKAALALRTTLDQALQTMKS